MEKWIWHIALLKAIKKIVQLFVSWLIAQNLERFGISLDPVKITVVIFGILEFVRNWMKGKFKIGWL